MIGSPLAAQLAGIGPYPPQQLNSTGGTTDLLAANNNNWTMSNVGAASAPTFVVDDAAPINTIYRFVAFNGGFGMVVKMGTTQVLYTGGSPSSAGGTATYSAQVGASFTIQKITSTVWVRIASSGADVTLA